MKITIETIPHGQQRYSTLGDWTVSNAGAFRDEITIRVSETDDWHHNVLIGIHELVEAVMCLTFGVSQAEVDKFDQTWTPHSGIREPGDDPLSPYKRWHCFATGVERLLAGAMMEDWERYEKNCQRIEEEALSIPLPISPPSPPEAEEEKEDPDGYPPDCPF